jgi:hypothetical protein
LELADDALVVHDRWWEVEGERGEAWRQQEAEAAAAKVAEEKGREEEKKRMKEEKKAKMQALAARIPASLAKKSKEDSPVLVKQEPGNTNGTHAEAEEGEIEIVEASTPKSGGKRLTKSEKVVRVDGDVVSFSSVLFCA